MALLLADLELLQCLFVDRESQPGNILVQVNEPVFGFGFAVKDVPEQFVAHFYLPAPSNAPAPSEETSTPPTSGRTTGTVIRISRNAAT